MKRPILTLIATCLCLSAGIPTSIAQPATNHDVQVLPSGVVIVDGHPFMSWLEYVQSDFFLENGMRCGVSDPKGIVQAKALAIQGPPSDCTLTFSNPSSEYDPGVEKYLIPVVVHVIQHTDGTGYLDAATIQSQIDILNEDFLALPGTNGAAGTDIQIEFYLATVNPSGNPTNGITYTTNDTWFNDDGTYYNTLAWDTNQYMNIYTNTAGGFLGYVPGLPQHGIVGSTADRIVILYDSFGRNSPLVPYDQGRTATHEVGHYLGLYHVFSGCGTPCTSSGDLICDTFQQSTPNGGCSNASTCGETDSFRNYMDYTNDLCMTDFTYGQALRMRCSLENWRSDLWESALSCPIPPTPDCNENCILDADDIAAGTSTDCNQNAIPDSCEFGGSFAGNSGVQGPIGTGISVTHVFPSPPPASGDVTISFQAVADITSRSQRLNIYLNNTFVGLVYEETVSVSCANPPALDDMVIPFATYNSLVNGGDATIRVDANGVMDPLACSGTTVEFDMTYDTSTAVDVNFNGIPDSCEYANGDNNLDGVIDVDDLLALLAKWGACSLPCPEDTDLDGDVDVDDLLNLLAGWS
ncbi:MAG: zinc metalloprotease [Planctomycetota bacterium]|nr:zinc metalloprotease [Planctomycetota bacterium]